MTNRTRTAIVACLLAQGLAGCEGSHNRPFALGPSLVGTPPEFAVTGLSPVVGSTGGGAAITIAGSGFQLGSTATFDSATVAAVFDTRNGVLTNMRLETPPHAPGTVDVVVTNPDGRKLVLREAYTYVSPDSFDFNGSWEAASFDGSDRQLEFTIEDNRLVRATCRSADGQVVPLSIPSPPAITHGEFAFEGIDGIRFSGRMVTSTDAIGTMNFAACNAMTWQTYPSILRGHFPLLK
jgi:hypothetical protein